MSPNRRTALPYVFLSVPLLVACTDELPTTARDRSPAHQARAATVVRQPFETPDARFMRLNDDLPGFGGLFVDSIGTPHIYLTEPSRRDQALPVVAAYLEERGPRGAALAASLVTLQGRYEFRQLATWRKHIKEQGVPAGVILLDVDDRLNRVTIGVADEAAEAQVREQLGELGIPEDAVAFETMSRPELLSNTVRDEYYPRIAGLQISTNNFGASCTLGYFAYDGNDSSTVYFVTNSHCTDTPWAVTGDWMGQPYQSDSLGYEIVDPPLFDYTAPSVTAVRNDDVCPQFNPQLSATYPARCRFSDAAMFAATYHAISIWHGRIAGTLGGSLTITDSWTINSTTIVGVGEPVRKTGRTTGSTAGHVTRLCADAWHSTTLDGYDVWLLCQGAASFASDSGDSGAPVYVDNDWYPYYGDYNPVALQGILWGRAITGSQYPYGHTTDVFYSLTPLIHDEMYFGTGIYPNPVRGF